MRPTAASILLWAVAATAAEPVPTGILSPEFRTLKVQNAVDFMAPPTYSLEADGCVSVSFDEIADDFRRLRYRLVHLNSDGTPSALVDSELLDSFNIADIDDFAPSTNTFVRYWNYRFTVPSETMRPLVSGNYVAEVFDESDEDTVLLRVPFKVSEDIVRIEPAVTSRTDAGHNTRYQQVSFTIDPGQFKIDNPYADLKVVVTQNGRSETARTVAAPLRIDGRRLIYDHTPALIFPAGNEYRRFETVRADYPGLHADSVRYVAPVYQTYLTPDESRAGRQYAYDRTQHGRFMVREYNSSDSDLGADYVTVNFTLDFPRVMDGDIYVCGELTGNRCLDAFRMRYDEDSHLYRLAMPLKQGSYNYQYRLLRRGESGATADPSPVEGDYFETGNEYTIDVYLRRPGDRADRLIGSTTIYTD